MTPAFGVMKSRLLGLLNVISLLAVLLPTLSGLVNASEIELACEVAHQITEEFDNGAGWGMCWEAKRRENIVLSDIQYRNSSGVVTPVISSIRLSQLHVAYDDNNVTYNDVTQFGLGGGYQSTLTPTDCPNGNLIDINGRAGLCQQLDQDSNAYRTATATRRTQILKLFSTSHVGAYTYLVTWKFYDDGSVEPFVGAAGALQRSGDHTHADHGRELEGDPNTVWLSHTHNYYWRIDFDLGDSANDDVVSEVSYQTDTSGRRARATHHFTDEVAREIDRDSMRSWYITDQPTNRINATEADITHLPGYLIEPTRYGHKLVRETVEPYTQFDFFVTKQNDCERFSSENERFNPNCGDNVLDFVDNESLIGEDIVVWHRISFHHVPRNEDRAHMHSHWDGFLMKARNLNESTPGHSGIIESTPPSIVAPKQLSHTKGEAVTIELTALDSEGNALSYTATGLPTGVTLDTDGVIRGKLESRGDFTVQIRATDAMLTSSTTIQWRVNDNAKGGLLGSSSVWLFLITLVGLVSRRSNSAIV